MMTMMMTLSYFQLFWRLVYNSAHTQVYVYLNINKNHYWNLFKENNML